MLNWSQTLVSCINELSNQVSTEPTIQCKVQTLTLNRPTYVGFTVLELSKLHMYDFHYNHMKVNYPHANQLRLLFTDTDSLAYAVETDNTFKDTATDAADRYYFSGYPFDHPLYDASNRKALGFFKDKLNSVPMQEFVGLRPKCYAFLCTGKVNKNVLQHTRSVIVIDNRRRQQMIIYISNTSWMRWATFKRLSANRISYSFTRS